MSHTVSPEKKEEVLAYLLGSRWRFDFLRSCACEVNAAAVDWPPRGSLKPRPDFHLDPGTPKVSYLETVWISVNLPLTSSDRIKPARTCVNEWTCLYFCPHQHEAVHLKSGKKKKQICETHMIAGSGTNCSICQTNSRAGQGSALAADRAKHTAKYEKEIKGDLTLFFRFYPWVNHRHHRPKSTCLSFLTLLVTYTQECQWKYGSGLGLLKLEL